MATSLQSEKKGRILGGWVQKSPEPCPAPPGRQQENHPAGVPTPVGS